jgi:hypothetical protein
LKLPTENDPVGDPSKEHELDELQRMVRENEQALKRANKMILDLRKHLGKEGDKPSPALRSRRKK